MKLIENENQWKATKIIENHRKSLKIKENQWKPIKINEINRKTIIYWLVWVQFIYLASGDPVRPAAQDPPVWSPLPNDPNCNCLIRTLIRILMNSAAWIFPISSPRDAVALNHRFWQYFLRKNTILVGLRLHFVNIVREIHGFFISGRSFW